MLDKMYDFINRELIKYSLAIIEKSGKKLIATKVSEGFDRNYIDDYICSCRQYIKGDVLEFNGDILYGENLEGVNLFKASYIDEKDKGSDYYFDIRNRETLPEKKFDCIIATQVICYMLDGAEVLKNLKSMLREQGVLIITNSGPIYQDNYEYEYETFYTKKGLERLCKSVFKDENVFNLKNYGDLEYSLYSLLGIKRMPNDKIVGGGNLSVIIGCCCKKT